MTRRKTKIDTEFLPLVVITWKDHTSRDEWMTSETARKLAVPKIILSVGWLHHETDEGYSLVSCICTDDNDVSNQQFILKNDVVDSINIPPPKKRLK